MEVYQRPSSLHVPTQRQLTFAAVAVSGFRAHQRPLLASTLVPRPVQKLRMGRRTMAHHHRKIGDIVAADCCPHGSHQCPASRPKAKKLGDQCFYGLTCKQGKATSSPPASTPSSDRLIIIGLFVVVLYAGFHSAIPITRPTVLSVMLAVGAQQLAKHKAIDIILTYSAFSRDDVILLVAYASRTENQDAIDMGVVQMLGDSAKAHAGITLLDFKPFNPADWLGSSTLHKERTCMPALILPAHLSFGLYLTSGSFSEMTSGLGRATLGLSLQFILAKIMFVQRSKGVKITDLHVRFTNEVLQGIRLTKYYAWEDFYSHQIGALRQREIATMRNMGIAHATLEFVQAWCLTPYEIRDNEEKDSVFRGFCTGESAGDCQEPAVVLQRSRAVEPAVARADRDVHNAAAGLQAARPRWVDVVIQEHLATHYGV
ncbi:hypothetical protein C8J57DRAFT_1566165 [Mycena rebaudengoi]|nr:hypothetical protein C8J57DRAFT_1566165 [Mycena rebaudengoi]